MGYPILQRKCMQCGSEFQSACRNAKWCPTCRVAKQKQWNRDADGRRRNRVDYHDYVCDVCNRRIRVFDARAHGRKICTECLESLTDWNSRERAARRKNAKEVVLSESNVR